MLQIITKIWDNNIRIYIKCKCNIKLVKIILKEIKKIHSCTRLKKKSN